MNFLHASYIKKTTAVIFISLFVFVHAVKAFHTHEFSLSVQHAHDENGVDIKSGFACSICDFQIAKDCDAVVANLQVQVLQQTIQCFYNYYFSVYHSKVHHSSGTDPPSLA